jgi:hypothetical protein
VDMEAVQNGAVEACIYRERRGLMSSLVDVEPQRKGSLTCRILGMLVSDASPTEAEDGFPGTRRVDDE